MSDAKIAGISSTAVEKATGKSWKEWITTLDKAKAAKLPHKDIAKLLHEKHGLSSWWSQMVTVGYEQAMGLRKAHQRPEGFQISRSKTMPYPVSRIFRAWKDRTARDKWLKDQVAIRKATSNKSLRITRSADGTNLEINLYPGNGKCQVVIQHSKLKSASEAQKMKKYWGSKLENLNGYLRDMN